MVGVKGPEGTSDNELDRLVDHSREEQTAGFKLAREAQLTRRLEDVVADVVEIEHISADGEEYTRRTITHE